MFEELVSRIRHWKLKAWPVVVAALGGLIVLNVGLVLQSRQKTQQIFERLEDVYLKHGHVEARLQLLRSDIHLSGIYLRDYLLDNSHLTSGAYRERLIELRRSIEQTLREVQQEAIWPDPVRFDGIRQSMEDYWETFEPLLDWTPAQKSALSAVFLRRTVLPKRDAVMSIVREVEQFNNAVMREQRAQAAAQERELHQYMNRTVWVSLMLGLLVAGAAGWRFHIIEERAEGDRARSLRAEDEMRRLSHQLVKMQEEERRNLSRELHDQVGQMLTALRMEVGKAEKSRGSADAFAWHVASSKEIIDTMVRTVRDLSMGLRPSMLDDFGLGPALEWQARDFSRRYDIPVNVTIVGELDRLPETYRTCIYRVTQEALTNCARHAQASQISITLRRNGDHLSLLVHDDGVGIAELDEDTGTGPGARGSGLGLLGIQERVRELHGEFHIHSPGEAGTTLQISLPLERAADEEIEHANRARR